MREHGAALARQLAAALGDEAELVRFSEDDLAGDPDRLAIEAQTVSMFSPSKVLHVRAGGRAAGELAAFPWDRLPDNVRVVVEAGNLRKDAKLRKVFETAKMLVALPCHDGSDPANIAQVVRGELSAAGLIVDGDAERHLAGLLGADLGLARSELAKLVTYAQQTGRVTIEDIDAVIGDASQVSLDAAVDAILASDPRSAQQQMDKLRASGTPLDVLLSSLSQHLLRLLRLRAKLDAGNSADAALKSFRPPLHFKRADVMKRQIRQWDRTRLKHALEMVSRALKQARLNPMIAHQIVVDTIERLSRLGTAETAR